MGPPPGRRGKRGEGGVGNFYHQGGGRRSSHEWRSVKAWKPAEGVTLLLAFSSRLLPADLIVLGGNENIRHAPHGVGEVRGRIISDIGFSAWNIQYRSPPPERLDSFSVSTAELFTPGEAGMRSSQGYFSFVSRWTLLLVLIGAGKERQGFWNERLTLYKTISRLSIESVV